MIKTKIKTLMVMHEKSNKDLANCLNIDYQSFSNKLNKNRFKTDELIKIGIETGTRLAFIDDNNNPVVIFTEDDLIK